VWQLGIKKHLHRITKVDITKAILQLLLNAAIKGSYGNLLKTQ